MFFVSIFFTALFMLLLDYLWIKLIMHDLYFKAYKSLLVLDGEGIGMRLLPAVLVYLLLLAAIYYFAVLPSRTRSTKVTLMKGAFVGLYGYGLYDLTNQALFVAWDPFISLIDMAWGCFLCATTAFVAKKLLNLSTSK